MSELVSELLDIPWFRMSLLVIIGFSALVVALMLPMYFVIWPFLRRIRAELAAFTAKLAGSFRDDRRARRERLDTRADEFLTDSELQRVVASSRWVEHSAAVRAMRRLRKPVGRSAKAITATGRAVAELATHLRQVNINTAQALPEVSSAAELVESHAGYRRAWLTLVASVVLLVGLMTVNTTLTSTILPAIGVVSPSVQFGGIGLATFIAFLLASTEAGVGLCHAATKDPDRFKLWPYFFLGLALVISMFDGWAFSQIGQAANVFFVPLIGYEMRQSDLFFLFGLGITWTLFGLGALAFESGTAVLGGRRGDLLKGALRRLRTMHDKYAKSVQKATVALQDAGPAIATGEKHLNGPGGENVAASLDALRREVEEMRTADPVGLHRGRLQRTEVWQLANYAGMWFVGALLGLVVMIVMSSNRLESVVTASVEWGLAIGQSLVCVCAGSLLHAGETMVVRRGPDENHRPVVSGSMLSRVIAYVMMGALLAMYVVLAVVSGRGWLINIVGAVSLAAAGYVLMPLLGVMSLWFGKWWIAIVSAAAAVVLFLLRVVRAVVVVLESIARLFAGPLDRLFGGRGAPPAAGGMGREREAEV
ncbi:MAG TPA: hypothetical protein VI485_06375 [Vicinamibacterales bacterium]|nr:hypothetical protein [Vicinamibacterales bacterium]